MHDKHLAAWRAAVAAGESTQGFESWIADQDNMPRYIVAMAEVTVYQYVDIDDGSVVRVVVDDFTMTPIEQQLYRYANSSLQVMWLADSDDDPEETEIERAANILSEADHPSWEIGWS